jgi:glutathionylspermidine synthase
VKRRSCAQRDGWRARVEDQGLLFHHVLGEAGAYWAEGTYYEFTAAEVDAIEIATDELHARCLDAVEHVIANKRYAELGIPSLAVPLIERSWEDEPPSIYGRMDLAFGDGVPKLLEYNADTPTSLLEGSVIQWTWLDDCFPTLDQFNSIHERLLAGWKELAPYVGTTLHFGLVDDVEDAMTIAYLRDTAEQAGIRTVQLAMEDIGWDGRKASLVDLDAHAIESLFKLYPWEGLLVDDWAPLLPQVRTKWLEPAWKMVLSNKAILPILWELFPGHPNLLPAARELRALPDQQRWVKKPMLGREGNNVTVVVAGDEVATSGPYGAEGHVFQQYADLGDFDGMRPVIGSWVIAGESAGMGIRETKGYVTNNTARFVPHVIAT